jgi:hypothetical protein
MTLWEECEQTIVYPHITPQRYIDWLEKTVRDLRESAQQAHNNPQTVICSNEICAYCKHESNIQVCPRAKEKNVYTLSECFEGRKLTVCG